MAFVVSDVSTSSEGGLSEGALITGRHVRISLMNNMNE